MSSSRFNIEVRKSSRTRLAAENKPACGVVMMVTPSVPPNTMSTPVGWRKYLRLTPVEAMPATVAIAAMAMPTSIPKSTCGGRSAVADGAFFDPGASLIIAGDVDKRYLPSTHFARSAPLDHVASEGPICSEHGAFATKELRGTSEIRQRCLLSGFSQSAAT